MVRDTEMLVLNKRSDVYTVNIHLRTYTSRLTTVTDRFGDDHSLPTQYGWDVPFNLFGNTVPDFPIVFRNSEASGPDKFANFQVTGVTTMHQLIDAYNAWQSRSNTNLRITGKTLRVNLDKLQALVAYSKAVARQRMVVTAHTALAKELKGTGNMFREHVSTQCSSV